MRPENTTIFVDFDALFEGDSITPKFNRVTAKLLKKICDQEVEKDNYKLELVLFTENPAHIQKWKETGETLFCILGAWVSESDIQHMLAEPFKFAKNLSLLPFAMPHFHETFDTTVLAVALDLSHKDLSPYQLYLEHCEYAKSFIDRLAEQSASSSPTLFFSLDIDCTTLIENNDINHHLLSYLKDVVSYVEQLNKWRSESNQISIEFGFTTSRSRAFDELEAQRRKRVEFKLKRKVIYRELLIEEIRIKFLAELEKVFPGRGFDIKPEHVAALGILSADGKHHEVGMRKAEYLHQFLKENENHHIIHIEDCLQELEPIKELLDNTPTLLKQLTYIQVSDPTLLLENILSQNTLKENIDQGSSEENSAKDDISSENSSEEDAQPEDVQPEDRVPEKPVPAAPLSANKSVFFKSLNNCNKQPLTAANTTTWPQQVDPAVVRKK